LFWPPSVLRLALRTNGYSQALESLGKKGTRVLCLDQLPFCCSD
jgi:hypothetical protein